MTCKGGKSKKKEQLIKERPIFSEYRKIVFKHKESHNKKHICFLGSDNLMQKNFLLFQTKLF